MPQSLQRAAKADGGATNWKLADSRLPERLGRTAFEALSGDLWAGRGFYESSLKTDYHRVNRTLSRSAAGPDFSTVSIRCFDVMLDLATAVPLWVGYKERDRLADRLPALLKFDPQGADPVHPTAAGDSSLRTLRRALYVAALIKACAWEPKPKLTEGRNKQLETLQERISARLTAQVRYLTGSTIAPDTHAYIVYSFVRALEMRTMLSSGPSAMA